MIHRFTSRAPSVGARMATLMLWGRCGQPATTSAKSGGISDMFRGLFSARCKCAERLTGVGRKCLDLRGLRFSATALRKRCSTVELRWLDILPTCDRPWQPALSRDKSTACTWWRRTSGQTSRGRQRAVDRKNPGQSLGPRSTTGSCDRLAHRRLVRYEDPTVNPKPRHTGLLWMGKHIATRAGVPCATLAKQRGTGRTSANLRGPPRTSTGGKKGGRKRG